MNKNLTHELPPELNKLNINVAIKKWQIVFMKRLLFLGDSNKACERRKGNRKHATRRNITLFLRNV
jgi:hypothetical protein